MNAEEAAELVALLQAKVAVPTHYTFKGSWFTDTFILGYDGTPERFVETFHDDGQTDMVAAMRAYAEIGFAGPLRPDHVPTMAGEENDMPGYQTLGRLFALGYIKGLIEAVGHESAPGATSQAKSG